MENKILNEREKIQKMEELFDEINRLFPDNSASLSLHDIDVIHLDGKWKVERTISDTGEVYFTGKRNNEYFDITLFGKHYENLS